MNILIAILVTIVVLGLVLLILPARSVPITDGQGNIIEGSISEWREIEIGGVPQWISIRGHSIDNPVLLFLHGGPGTPETAFLYEYNQNLEEEFTIVSWEQRGSGRSYRSDFTKETMNIEQFPKDAHELTQYLKKEFN